MKRNEWYIVCLLFIIFFLCGVLEVTNQHSDDEFWAASDSLHVNGDRCLRAESLGHIDSLRYYMGKMDAWFEVENKELKKRK